jgi:hypothetical protein
MDEKAKFRPNSKQKLLDQVREVSLCLPNGMELSRLIRPLHSINLLMISLRTLRLCVEKYLRDLRVPERSGR